MGSPQAGLVLAPVGMPVARRCRVDPVVMAIAINAGIATGGFAPTSLFGIVSYRVAREAGIVISPFTVLGVAVVANLVLLIGAMIIFGRTSREIDVAPAADAPIATDRRSFERSHIATLACMVGLAASVIACAVSGIQPDIGVLAFAFGAVLALAYPASGEAAVGRIDWSTVFMVGGIVGMLLKLARSLQNLAGSISGHERRVNVGTPLVIAALVICMTSADRMFAFASTASTTG